MKRLLIAGLAAVAAANLLGCVQLPTEKQSVSDIRPQISFRLAEGIVDAASLRVFVDGLDMGQVTTYLEGKQSLRILPGQHVIRVEQDRRIVLEERIYIGEGVSRTLIIR